MAGNHKLRKRKIDLNKLTPAQADRMAKQIGNEIAKLMDQANEECNKLLKIYGLQTAIAYNIVKLDEKPKKRTKKSAAKKVAKT